LEQTRRVGVAKSERPRLTNGEIIFEEFQPMWSQFTNVTDGRTDGRTDGQTDRQTTCDRNTALCTKVHRAVKTDCVQYNECGQWTHSVCGIEVHTDTLTLIQCNWVCRRFGVAVLTTNLRRARRARCAHLANVVSACGSV